MSLIINSSNTGQLIYNISKKVGRSNGFEYFRLLLDGLCNSFAMPYGVAYEISGKNKYSLKELANYSAQGYRTLKKINLDPSSIEFLLKTNLFNCRSHIRQKLPNDKLLKVLEIDSVLSIVLYSSDGRPIGLIATMSDQHKDEIAEYIDVIESQAARASAELERLRIQRTLYKYESKYRYLIETSKDVVWTVNRQGVFEEINRAATGVFGYRPDEIIGKHYSEFMSVEAAISFNDYLLKAMAGNNIYGVVTDHINRDGNTVEVTFNAKPKYDEYGELIGVTGATTNITESVRAKLVIKNNSELFSAILSRMPVVFFRVDEKGDLVDIRGKGLRRMGVEDMDWVGKPGYGLFVGMDEMIDAALSGKTVLFESEGVCQGNPWWFMTSMFFDSWTGFGAVGFSVDITEQKIVEAQLVDLLKENRQLAQHLVEVQEDERRNLSRELHDELGQSITAVKSLATAITAKSGSEYSEIRSLGNSIVDLSGRLYEVVSNIMRRLRPDVLDSLGFEATIKNCIVRSQLEQTGIQVNLEMKKTLNDLGEVILVTVYRIVQECLTNIAKYAMASNVDILIDRKFVPIKNDQKKGYTVSTKSSKKGTANEMEILLISITDDGIGMDLETDMKSMEQRKKMGLQGMRERVTALGGELMLESQKGSGVTIVATIDLDFNVSPDTLESSELQSAIEVSEDNILQRMESLH